MSAALPIPQSWQTAFDAQPNVGAFRKQAFADFVARGLPTGKLDAWKYTDLRRLTLRQFRLPTDGSVANVDDALLPLTNGARLVFVDGLPASSLARRADGVSITATSHCAKLGTDAFDLLNAALSSRTERIEVAAKYE